MSLLWRKRTPIPARRPGGQHSAGSFLARLQAPSCPSPARFLHNALLDKPHQEYGLTVRGQPPMGTRLCVMCLCLGILSTVMACAVTPPAPPSPPMTPPVTAPSVAPSAVPPPETPAPADVPPVVVPLPSVRPPSTTGTRASDTYQPSPYERKMDEEEQQYRQQRAIQERAQEQRYRQWEQERERERDPRYEWMR
jgi:hypothetical protein